MKFPIITLTVLVLAPWSVFAETPKPVQAALDYQLPENTCTKPRIIASESTVLAPAQDGGGGGSNFFQGSNTGDVSDIDGYSRKRIERKEKRWRKCVATYKADLLDDMQQLKGSASHGVTQEQADSILKNMALIQQVYMTSEGVLESTD